MISFSDDSNIHELDEINSRATEIIKSGPASKEKSFALTYSFTSREIALLAKFLRSNQDKLPNGLESFYKSLEDTVYNNLTLDEAGIFYS